jgi:hypothetical protein
MTCKRNLRSVITAEEITVCGKRWKHNVDTLSEGGWKWHEIINLHCQNPFGRHRDEE